MTYEPVQLAEDRRYVAVRIVFASPFDRSSERYTISRSRGQWLLKTCYTVQDKPSRVRTVIRDADETVEMLTSLFSRSIPLLVNALPVCDGEMVQVTVAGWAGKVSVEYMTVPPAGFECFGRLVSWLRRCRGEIRKEGA